MYRFGFNGQEKDDEITGVTGSHYTAMFWEYDTRIALRWNVDPKPNPAISPYAVFAGNPIMYTDPFGDTLRYEKFRDRVNVFFRRAFDSDFNDRATQWASAPEDYYFTRRENKPNLGSAFALTTRRAGEVGSLPELNLIEYSFWPRRVGPQINFGVDFTIDLRGQKDVRQRYVILNGDHSPVPNPANVQMNANNVVPGTNVEMRAAEYPDTFTINDNNGNVLMGPTNVVNADAAPYNNVQRRGVMRFQVPPGTTQLQINVTSQYNWPGGNEWVPSRGDVRWTEFRFPRLVWNINF